VKETLDLQPDYKMLGQIFHLKGILIADVTEKMQIV